MQLIKDWHAAREKLAIGVSALVGVYFYKRTNAWGAQANDPATGKQIYLLYKKATEPDAEILCGKAYDRQQLKWRGRCTPPPPPRQAPLCILNQFLAFPHC